MTQNPSAIGDSRTCTSVRCGWLGAQPKHAGTQVLQGSALSSSSHKPAQACQQHIWRTSRAEVWVGHTDLQVTCPGPPLDGEDAEPVQRESLAPGGTGQVTQLSQNSGLVQRGLWHPEPLAEKPGLCHNLL